jgi:hypothetical protein
MTNGVALLLAGALAVPAPAPAAPPTGRLLPVPDPATGVTAVDVSPYGVVAGTTADGRPQRWARVPRAGWLRQALALPAGATAGTVSGLTDRGEAGGAVTVDGVSRAVRWSVDGRSATLIGADRSQVSAVGPRGPWGVSTTGPEIISGEAELVRRDGSRTPLRGTPELDAGYRPAVGSIGGPDTALVWVVAGIGQGTNTRPVLWHNGATVRLPVVSAVFFQPACVSRVRPDGSVVAGGYTIDGGSPSLVMVRHVGGAPGTDVELARGSAPGQPYAGISCTPGLTSNTLASDGGIAGFRVGADGRRSAAYWSPADVMTVVPPEPGERSATGVAVASGGRMVILAEGDDGSTRLSLWRAGVRTPLAAPAGWTVASVVELTDAGLLVANVRDAAGTVRPAAWHLGG